MAPTLVFIALTSAGLFVLRRREPASRGFRAPGYPATPALFALLILGVVASIALARPLQALAGFTIVLLGIPAHRILSSRGALDSPREGGR